MKNIPIKQHYVPKFLINLYKLNQGNTDLIVVNTALSKFTFFNVKNSKNILNEKNLYTMTKEDIGIEEKEDPYFIEKKLSILENQASIILNKITKRFLDNKNTFNIDREEEVVLKKFLIIQSLRTPASMKNFSILSNNIARLSNGMKMKQLFEEIDNILEEVFSNHNVSFKFVNKDLVPKVPTRHIPAEKINLYSALMLSDNPALIYLDKEKSDGLILSMPILNSLLIELSLINNEDNFKEMTTNEVRLINDIQLAHANSFVLMNDKKLIKNFEKNYNYYRNLYITSSTAVSIVK
ncbi:DUF4238 domain-containing protein [Macrococcoides goetzii]|nr:DUF4238 domain-containing protein [Macrococcus goetzii]TDM50434.1 DUF4238 domain-containing protein [Macrococcus goetzii]